MMHDLLRRYRVAQDERDHEKMRELLGKIRARAVELLDEEMYFNPLTNEQGTQGKPVKRSEILAFLLFKELTRSPFGVF